MLELIDLWTLLLFCGHKRLAFSYVFPKIIHGHRNALLWLGATVIKIMTRVFYLADTQNSKTK